MLNRESTISLRDIECVSAGGSSVKTTAATVVNTGGDTSVDCSGLRLYPALWNAHEHLEFNLYPHIGHPPYPNAYEWGLHITKRSRDPRIDKILRVPERTRYYWGALKNILSASPYVLHHGDTPAYLFSPEFPVTVIPNHGSPHSLRFERALVDKAMSGAVRSIHLAEGVDIESECELGELDTMGLLDRSTAIVHGVGLTENDIDLMSARGSSFIWCPSSNEFLFGKHAPVRRILDARIPVMLGTDSTLTGSDGMLSELRRAVRVLKDSAALFDIATGTLSRWVAPFFAPGSDSFFIARKHTEDPLADFTALHRRDVVLVVHHGKVLLYDPAIVDLRLPVRTKMTIDGEMRYVAGDWGVVLRDASKLGADFMGGISPC